MQEIVVIAIVILAVVYLLFRFKNNSKNKGCDKCCK
ncbi:MAG: FeoB-associated Cys-rich membrane protein [Flavobacteriales bacterium]|nr:FeoB-associated Cys-rich membrane protein [Flavobacteriales bacterium]